MYVCDSITRLCPIGSQRLNTQVSGRFPMGSNNADDEGRLATFLAETLGLSRELLYSEILENCHNNPSQGVFVLAVLPNTELNTGERV